MPHDLRQLMMDHAPRPAATVDVAQIAAAAGRPSRHRRVPLVLGLTAGASAAVAAILVGNIDPSPPQPLPLSAVAFEPSPENDCGIMRVDEDGQDYLPAVLARRSTTWAAVRAWGRIPHVVANVEMQLREVLGVTGPFDDLPVVICVYEEAAYTAALGSLTWTESSTELVLNINPGDGQANMGVVIMGDPATGGWDPNDLPAPAAP